MLCNCYPIYWGSPKIQEYFLEVDEFDNIEDLEKILPTLTKERYDDLCDWDGDPGTIWYNMFQVNDKFMCLEDWIYDWVLWPWMEKNGLLNLVIDENFPNN